METEKQNIDALAGMSESTQKFVAAAQDGTVKLVALVRDRDGKPKFDDPNNVPQIIMDMLTAEDKAYLATLQNEVT